MRIATITLAGVLAIVAYPASGAEPPQVVQSRGPLATGGVPVPDMEQLQHEWGHARVAQEAARVVAESPDLLTASRTLWDARLSEVTFPVEILGEPTAWFEVVSPLQEVDVSEAGLRSLWGALPETIVERDRLGLTCLDEAGLPLDADLILGGPEEVLPSGTSVLYVVDNIDDCWTAGGVSLMVHAADADPLVLASDPATPRLAGNMASWGAASTPRDVPSAMNVLSTRGDTASGGAAANLFGDSFDHGFDALLATVTDCSREGPCPENTDCEPLDTCSCDEHGSIVTRDLDHDGCPDQRTTYTYDNQGRITASEHDWQNDGVYDERCRYPEPCAPGTTGCKRSCAELMGK